MASTKKAELERQDRQRDAAFNTAMHGNSAEAVGGIRAMFSKGNDAKKAAVDEYFKHWDHQAAKDETEETREVSGGPMSSNISNSLRIRRTDWLR